jgi:hypothetical protein
MEKMTIHRALSELKLIDAKIEKAIAGITPTGMHQKEKLVNGQVTQEQFAKDAQGYYDQALDLMRRKTAIKSAIVQSNGTAQVTVGGKQMSVADAINAKVIVKFKKRLIQYLTERSRSVVAGMNNNNSMVQQNLQKLLEVALGKDAVKADGADVQNIRKPYLEANEFHLFDPLKVEDKIKELEKEIGDFEADVDAVLSESNAVTFIEF